MTATLPSRFRARRRAAGPRSWSRVEVGAVLIVWTLIGLLFASTIYLRAGATGEPANVGRAAVLAASDVYTWAAISLVALWAARRFPLERGQWARSLTVHMLLALVLVTVRALLLHYFLRSTGWFPERPLDAVLSTMVPVNFASYWLVAGGTHALVYARRLQEREVSTALLETQLARAQLQMLKMQIHPHFLFNTLHAISSLVHREPEAAERMIASLSEMLRSTLAHQQLQEVSLAEEMDLLEPYLDIEKTRLGERLALRIEVEPEALEARVPHLILQPLVENAIRHGIAPRRQGGTVAIRAGRRGDRVWIRVEDDGQGFRSGAGDGRPGGVGLTNARARLAQLYGSEHGFSIESQPGAGARVEISLPFRSAGPPAELTSAAGPA